jgi:hypothetical protein
VSDFGAEALRRATTWSLDGTSAPSPAPFSRICTLVAVCDGVGHAAGFGFLPDKTRLAYADLFRELRNVLLAEGPATDFPKQAILDFDVDMIRALRLAFPEIGIISLCHGHLCRSVQKDLEKNHLAEVYFRSKQLPIFIKNLTALAYHPGSVIPEKYSELVEKNLKFLFDEVSDIYEADLASRSNSKRSRPNNYLSQTAAPPSDKEDLEEELDTFRRNVECFLDHFETHYIGRKSRGGTFLKPTYAPDLWCQHEAVLAAEQTSSDHNESLRAALSASIKPKATLLAVIRVLQDLDARAKHAWLTVGDPGDADGYSSDLIEVKLLEEP